MKKWKNWIVALNKNPNFALENFFQKYSNIDKEESYAVAVSGGPDSMALLHALLNYKKIRFHILTVNHGLREGIEKEIEVISKFVNKMPNANHIVLNWEGDKPNAAIMEAARHARYGLMSDYCKKHKIKTLFVAHHQDDQAETFLIRLAKGSGLDGLAGMAATHAYDDNTNIVRPFLSLSKNELIDYCVEHDVPYVTDPSNENDDYLRPRLRKSQEILAEEGLTTKRLSVTVKRLRRAREALEILSEEACEKCVIEKNDNEITIDFDILKSYPEEVGLRVLQLSVEENRDDAAYNVRMERLEELFESLWFKSDEFKPRTLGGHIFSLKNNAKSRKRLLSLKLEK